MTRLTAGPDGVMAAGMVLMLVAGLTGDLAAGALALSLATVGWCLVQLARRSAPAAHGRLVVAGTAMAAMLLPLTASAAPVAVDQTSRSSSMPGMADMAGMAQTHAAVPTVTHAVTLPAPAVVLLLAALAWVALGCTLRAARPGPARGTLAHRLDLGCEAAMALVMGGMLAAAL